MSVMDVVGGFLTGGPVGAVIGFAKSLIAPLTTIFTKLEDTKVQLALAKTDEERVILGAKVSVLQMRADLMAKEAPLSRLNIYIRSAIGAEVAFLLGKILVWDKALGSITGGHTDPLDANLWTVMLTVLGFYFLHEIVSTFKKE